MRRASSGIVAALVALATAGLFAISRGKWSDALIDSGNEWILPDALSRGALLYRDAIHWFGPFTPYFQALFFALFGSSFRTLALADGVGGIGALAAFFFAARAVAGRAHAAAWTVLAIPLLVFMPYSGGVFIGMGTRMWHAAAFGLAAATLASKKTAPARDMWAGASAALAGLCRTEWGVAALVGCLVAVLLRSERRDWPAVLRVGAAFLAVFGAGIGFFVLRAGPDSVLKDAPVLLYNLPPETRVFVASVHPKSWFRGLVQMVYPAAVWCAAVFLLEVTLHRGDRRVMTRRLTIVGLLVVTAAAAAAVAGFPKDVFLAATPLVSAAALLLALRSPRGPRSAALGALGVMGVLTCYRRPFFIADGPYVAPPALFALACAAGCLAIWISGRPEEGRPRLDAGALAGIAAVAALLFVLRAIVYRSDDRIPIPGTGEMLSARADIIRDLSAVTERVRRGVGERGSLVVFPEGEVLNFLTGLPNPIRHKLYLPGYVNAENEPQILAELERARPTAVVIWPREVSEYRRFRFGVDYGQSIYAWIEREYELVGVRSVGRGPLVGLRRRSSS